MRRRLRSRYGRSGGHPLLPRLVMYLTREMRGKVPVFVISAKLQRHYGGPWETVYTAAWHWEASQARTILRSRARQLAEQYSVPSTHVEFA